MQYKDFYKTLGVSRSATPEEIKKAWRALARQHHPDVNKGDKRSEDKLKEINEAYDVLSDPKKRQMYDRLGANYEAYTRGGGAGAGGVNWEEILRNMGGFGGRTGGGSAGGGAPGGAGGFENFADIFGHMFNQAEAGARTAGSVEQEVEISLQEAFKGTSRILSKGGADIEVKIPAGVKTGSKVRVRGQGQRLRNGSTGDLMLVVSVQPDATYERKEDDLQADLKVDCFTAMLGGEVVAPTLSGSVVVKVPAGTNSGKMIRLRNRGMPKLQQPADFGDLYLRVMVTVPGELSDDQRKTLTRIAQGLQR